MPKEISVLDLDKKLGMIPHTSPEYKKILSKIQKKEKNTYGDQHILCIDSNKLKEEEFNTTKFEERLHYELLCKNLGFNNFSDTNTISGYHPRYMVEHDYKYKQVLTFGYITDRSRSQFVLLKKNDSNRLGMIGGHTDFGLSAYSTEPGSYLIENLYKELFEEVKILDKNDNKIDSKELLKAEITPQMFINGNDDHYQLRNVGFIYEMKLNVINLKDIFRFESNEPDIHTVELVPLEKIEKCNRYHSMLKYILQIVNRKIKVREG